MPITDIKIVEKLKEIVDTFSNKDKIIDELTIYIDKYPEILTEVTTQILGLISQTSCPHLNQGTLCGLLLGIKYMEMKFLDIQESPQENKDAS